MQTVTKIIQKQAMIGSKCSAHRLQFRQRGDDRRMRQKLSAEHIYLFISLIFYFYLFYLFIYTHVLETLLKILITGDSPLSGLKKIV